MGGTARRGTRGNAPSHGRRSSSRRRAGEVRRPAVALAAVGPGRSRCGGGSPERGGTRQVAHPAGPRLCLDHRGLRAPPPRRSRRQHGQNQSGRRGRQVADFGPLRQRGKRRTRPRVSARERARRDHRLRAPLRRQGTSGALASRARRVPLRLARYRRLGSTARQSVRLRHHLRARQRGRCALGHRLGRGVGFVQAFLERRGGAGRCGLPRARRRPLQRAGERGARVEQAHRQGLRGRRATDDQRAPR